jgi:hypothetical protein
MFDVLSVVWDTNGEAESLIVRTKHGNRERYEMKPNSVLMPSTGIFVQDGEELFYGDLVVYTGDGKPEAIRMVFWDNGWRICGVTTEAFEINSEDMAFKVGNKWENEDLYEKYLKTIIESDVSKGAQK